MVFTNWVIFGTKMNGLNTDLEHKIKFSKHEHWMFLKERIGKKQVFSTPPTLQNNTCMFKTNAIGRPNPYANIFISAKKSCNSDLLTFWVILFNRGLIQMSHETMNCHADHEPWHSLFHSMYVFYFNWWLTTQDLLQHPSKSQLVEKPEFSQVSSLFTTNWHLLDPVFLTISNLFLVIK